MAKIHEAARDAFSFPRLTGKLGGRYIAVELDDKVTLGRHPDNDVRVDENQVSKKHCVVERRGETFWVRDLGSSNGTFVNGKRVTEEPLWAGDVLGLGGTNLWFLVGQPPRDAAERGQATIVFDGSEVSVTLWFDGCSTSVACMTPDDHTTAFVLQKRFARLPSSKRVATALVHELLDELEVDGVEFFMREPLGTFESRASTRAQGVAPPGLVERVGHKGRAVISNDLRRDAAHLQVSAGEVRAVLAPPLREDARVTGVLVAARRESPLDFTLADARLALRLLSKMGARLLPPKPGVN